MEGQMTEGGTGCIGREKERERRQRKGIKGKER